LRKCANLSRWASIRHLAGVQVTYCDRSCLCVCESRFEFIQHVLNCVESVLNIQS